MQPSSSQIWKGLKKRLKTNCHALYRTKRSAIISQEAKLVLRWMAKAVAEVFEKVTPCLASEINRISRALAISLCLAAALSTGSMAQDTGPNLQVFMNPDKQSVSLKWWGQYGMTYFVQTSSSPKPDGDWTYEGQIFQGHEQLITGIVNAANSPRYWRLRYSFLPILGNPYLMDCDEDGLANGAEISTYGTDPLNADTDGDELPDGWEVAYGLDPFSGLALDGALGDPDDDTLSNFQEYWIGTSPQNKDTDGDKLPDWWELKYGLVPLIAAENEGADGDRDGDGFSNLEEYLAQSNPNLATSFPGSGPETGNPAQSSAPFTTFLAARGSRLDFDAEISRDHPWTGGYSYEYYTDSGLEIRYESGSPDCSAPATEKSVSQYRVNSLYSPATTAEYVTKESCQPFSRSRALGELSMVQGNDWTNLGSSVEVISSWGPLSDHEEAFDDCGGSYTGYSEEAMLERAEVRFQCNQPAPQELRQRFMLVRKDAGPTDYGWHSASCVGIIELRIPAGEMISRQAISESQLPPDIELTAGTIKMTAPAVDLNQEASYEVVPIEVTQTQLAQDGYSVQGEPVNISTFRLARWQDAWDANWNTKSDFISNDRDRVIVRFSSSVFANLSAEVKPVVKVSCSGDSTKLDMNLRGGYYESEPFLFVADADDDESYNGKAGMGKAEDGTLNDQTLSACSGQEVTIEFENTGGNNIGPLVMGRIAQPTHTISCDLILVNQDGLVSVDWNDAINVAWQQASETWAQVGVRLIKSGDVRGIAAPSEYWNAISNKTIAYNTSRLVNGELEWFSGWIRKNAPTVGKTLKIFLVKADGLPNYPIDRTKGTTMSVLGYQDLQEAVVCVDSNDQWPLTLAHEIGHFVGLEHPAGERNLMRAPQRPIEHDWLDSKRFRPDDEKKFKEYMKTRGY